MRLGSLLNKNNVRTTVRHTEARIKTEQVERERVNPIGECESRYKTREYKLIKAKINLRTETDKSKDDRHDNLKVYYKSQ